MITFWLVCGIFILIALAFVLPPLWQGQPAEEKNESEGSEENITIYRDQLAELESDLRNGIVSQEQYDQDRDEIKLRLLEDVSPEKRKPDSARPAQNDRRAAYALAITLPILAILLYAKLGNLSARTTEPDAAPGPAASSGAPGGMSQAQIEANVAALAKRLETNPSDAQGWTMLARSYTALEKFDESSKAYEKAVALKPRDAELLANYAFMLAMANGRNFEGRPLELIGQALKIEPDNVNVLGLAGGVAFEQKNYKQAIEYWNKLLSRVPPNSELAQAVNEKLKQAKALASGEGGKVPN